MKALFVSYGGGHIEMCLPVMRALRRRAPGCELRLMALTTASAVARAAGEAPLGYADFMDGADGPRARRLGELALAGNQHPDVSREESVAYLGLNIAEWTHELGEAGALQRFAHVGRHGFAPTRFFERVLRALRPDVVVATNSPRSEQAVVQAAAALGIPSLSMLDLFGLPGDPFLARPVQADRITVLSDGVAANLMAAGIAAQRIVVTGNPAFDALAQPDAVAQGQAWRRERGWDGLNVTLWAGHREPDDAGPPWAGTGLGRAVQARLIEWTLARNDVALAIRYHPNEWQDFDAPAPHPRIHWSVPGREGLTPVLMAADQVVVQATTVGAQAHAAGKRLIGLGFSPLVQRTGMDYARLGLGVGAQSLERLVQLLDEGVALRSGDHAASAQGGAADAVAREIAALASQPTVRAEPFDGAQDRPVEAGERQHRTNPSTSSGRTDVVGGPTETEPMFKTAEPVVRRVLALILARGGSKRLPGKNLRPLCGKPLIAWSIEAALACPAVTTTVVSTDAQDIADAALRHGARSPFLRPEALAQDHSSSADAALHAVDWLESQGETFDAVLLLEPTSPLRASGDLAGAVARLAARWSEVDAVVSVGRVHLEQPGVMKRLGDDGLLSPWAPEAGAAAGEAWFPYGVAYLVKTEALRKYRSFYPPRVLGHPIQRWQNYEVDDEFDFLCIESIMKHFGGRLP